MVRALAKTSSVFGITLLYGNINKRRHSNLLIIYYHRIVPSLSSVSLNSCQRLTGELVSVNSFEKQIRYVAERYEIVTLESLLAVLQNKEKGSHLAVITFDDAYREVYSNAFPVLKQYGLPATVFCPGEVVTDGDGFCPIWLDKLFYILDHACIDKFNLPDDSCEYRLGNRLQKRETLLLLIKYLRSFTKAERNSFLCMLAEQLDVKLSNKIFQNYYLTVDQIREMQKEGISFGSHTMSHPDLGQIPKDEVEREIIQSKMRLEKITEKQCEFFAYPFGEPCVISNFSMEVLRQNGFIGAVTTVDGINHPGDNPYNIKRVLAPGQDFQLFTFRCTGLSASLKSLFGKVQSCHHQQLSD